MKQRIAVLALSAAGIVGIATHEGYRDKAYFATAHEKQQGIVTLGFGETRGVKPGDTTTVEKSLVRLLATADEFQADLKECLNPQAELTQKQWDVLVGWAYNIGTGAACKSSLVRKLNANQEWCSELLRWNRQNGQVLPGLDRRRKEEYQKCVA